MVKLISSGQVYIEWQSLCLVVKFMSSGSGQVYVEQSSLGRLVKFMSSSLVLEKADS